MFLQTHKSSCGSASICNALETLGDHAYEEVVFSLAKGGWDGIGEKGLMEALETLGYRSEAVGYRVRARALSGLRARVRRGWPVIACVDDWSHWSTVVGMIGDRFLLADPADARLVISLDDEGMAKRWRSDSGRVPFYGIAVIPKERE